MRVVFFISACLRLCIGCQSTSNEILSITSHPNIVVLVTLTASYGQYAANVVAASTKSHGSFSINLFNSNDHIIFPIVWCMCLIIDFSWGFLVVITFFVPPKFFCIVSANLARNSVPLSTITFVGHGYYMNQVTGLCQPPYMHLSFQSGPSQTILLLGLS